MSPSRREILAIPLLDDAPMAQASEPLIAVSTSATKSSSPATATSHQLDEAIFSRFKLSALLLGVLVGFFIQFSTLGANFLVIQIWGEDILNKSRNDIVCFSLLWSFFTSAMAIIILAFLRNIVTIAYLSVLKRSQGLVEELVLHLECRFVVGALVGVCTAWTITDALMGMQAQIIYSVATLCIALVWCRIMMQCVRGNTETTKNKAIEQELDEEEPTQRVILIV